MRSRWTNSAAISLLAASAIACSDTAGPDPQDLVDVLLDFCATETPVFFAIQNEGDNWVRITPDAAGTFAFQATEQFTMALVHQDGSDFSTEYVFTTPEDIAPLAGVSCREEFGAKTLHGTVSGVPTGSAAMVSMAGSFSYLVAPSNAFTLTDLPTGTIDLIAHREVVGVNTVTPDRVIVRRAQDFVNGATLAPLDFNGTEAQAPVAHTFTTTGFSSNDDNYYLLTFNTATTRRHSLSTLVSFTSAGAQTVHGIPSALTQAGDWHELEVFADGGSLYRGEVHFYRTPSNRTVALGSSLNNPTLTTVATSPHLRLRTQLNSQFEYGAFVSVAHVQTGREVVLTATNSYFGGTPVVWDLTIPDLSGMAGFPSGALLQSGAGTDWYVDAYGGTGGLAAFFGAPTDAGATLHYAGRAFTTSARQMSRTRGAELPTRRRPRGLGAF